MLRLELHDGWSVTATGDVSQVSEALRGRAVPGAVPGCVHTDLLAAKLIDDPYVNQNDLALGWIGTADWQYRCTFTIGAEVLRQERVELACDGLDTLATITLNGQEIGRSESMHIAYRFDARSALRAGENELVITFAAPLPYAEAMRDKLGDLPASGLGSNPFKPHHFIRKMACNFGWDWGPPLTTSGIWRAIRLEAWSTARIAHVIPHVRKATPEQAVLQLTVEVEGQAKPAATLTAPDGTTLAADADLTFVIDKPRLWWPRGYGEQPRYTLTVTAGDDTWSARIGLRTVELVTDPDPAPVTEPVEGLGQGATMHLRVNGQRVWCKGANWIPDDCFPTRVTPARYRQRIEQTCDANMNMLRIWGGGTFESDTFYDLCDEMGVMVWQDFLCACACYSEEEPFRTLLREEAHCNVARLSRHPSLVLWNGCNENLMGFTDWWYKGKPWHEYLDGRGWGTLYYFETFREAVETYGGGVPYWPGSPYSGEPDLLRRRANLNEYGNRHIWDVWHGPGQYRNYLAHYSRFASEFGYHGPPTWPTLERSIPPDQRRWDSPAMLHHNKNGRNGQQQTHERMGDDFVQPAAAEQFDDWLYLAQVMQGRALAMGVEWFRALNPWCSGALIWQLNDCWPVSSWSMIDGDGRLKPLWYAARRFFAPRLVTIKTRKVTPSDEPIGMLAVFLHNDHAEPWTGQLQLRRLAIDGTTLNSTTQAISVAPRASAKVLVPDAWHDRPDVLLVADVGPHRGLWWFSPDKELAYPQPRFTTGITRQDGGYALKLHAQSLLRDVCLFADRLAPDAVVSEQLVTLLPGESHTFTIRTGATLDEAALTRPSVLQCVNRFGKA